MGLYRRRLIDAAAIGLVFALALGPVGIPSLAQAGETLHDCLIRMIIAERRRTAAAIREGERNNRSGNFCYWPLHCHRNVGNLLNLVKPNHDLSEARVLYFARMDQGYFNVHRTLDNRALDGRWKWHVVAESDGQVYDFDVAHPKHHLPVAHFFSDVLRPGIPHQEDSALPPNLLEEFVVAVIPAEKWNPGYSLEADTHLLKLSDYLAHGDDPAYRLDPATTRMSINAPSGDTIELGLKPER